MFERILGLPFIFRFSCLLPFEISMYVIEQAPEPRGFCQSTNPYANEDGLLYWSLSLHNNCTAYGFMHHHAVFRSNKHDIYRKAIPISTKFRLKSSNVSAYPCQKSKHQLLDCQAVFMLVHPVNFHPCVAILDVRLRAKKPVSKAYPSSLKTIGDRIRKRRLHLKLTQKQVAEMLSVDEASVWNWETGRTEPLVRQVPPVVTFLGYDPFSFDGKSLADELRRYRMMHGLTQKELAREIGIDPATLSRLEKEDTKCSSRVVKKATAFLEEAGTRKNP